MKDFFKIILTSWPVLDGLLCIGLNNIPTQVIQIILYSSFQFKAGCVNQIGLE